MKKFIFLLLGFFYISTSHAYTTNQITSTTSLQSLLQPKSCIPENNNLCKAYTTSIVEFINYLMICNTLNQLDVVFNPNTANTFILTSDPKSFCKVTYKNPTLKKPIICSFTQLQIETMISPKTNEALTSLNSATDIPDNLLETLLKPIYDCIHKKPQPH